MTTTDEIFSPETAPCDRCDETGPHLCLPRAQRAVDVCEQILVHTKSRWSSKPFLLEPWQKDEIIVPLFGRVVWNEQYSEWVRQYRIAWIELARKNGKSELCAAIALILLVADDEDGAEIYGCAKDRDQASKVFDVAARMVELSPILNDRLKLYRQRKRIVDEKTGSYYEIVASDVAGNEGHNPHGVIFDEVHTQPNDGLWNVMRTAMGARTQPLMVAATTAGNDPTSFCAAEHAYCEKVAEDPSIDPARFVFLRNTPKDADWEDEQNWYYANPALGSFLSLEDLRNEAREAKLAPARQNMFRQYRLNQWVQQASRWIDLGSWDESGKKFVPSRSTGRPQCWAGLDLASSTDIAALALCFPEDDDYYRFEWRYWFPEDKLRSLDERTASAASVWVKEGWLTVTEGNVIDYTAIIGEIQRLMDRYQIEEIGYDRWGMTQLAQDLQNLDLTVLQINQSWGSMSPPSKEFERLILEGKIVHGGNPVTRWMIDNVVVRIDPAGNIRPDKERSHEKIDGVVAAIMALDRAQRMETHRSSRRVISW